MQGQSKYSQCCGYSRSKRYLWCLDKTGAGEGPPPELWETDRTLERQKRKDIYFKLGQNRNKIQSRKWAWSSGNQTLWNTDLENGKQIKKGRLMPDDRGGKLVSSSLGSWKSPKDSGQVNEMMPFKANLWRYSGTWDIFGTRKTVLKPLH